MQEEQRGAVTDSPARSEYKLAPGLRYAGFLPRLIGFYIDALLITFLVYPIRNAIYYDKLAAHIHNWGGLESAFSKMRLVNTWDYVLFCLTPHQVDRLLGVWEYVLFCLVPLVTVVTFWRVLGATPGKLLFQARIIDARTGGRPKLWQCIVRYLGYFISVLLYWIGFVLIIINPRKKGLHDMLAGTMVVMPVDMGIPYGSMRKIGIPYGSARKALTPESPPN